MFTRMVTFTGASDIDAGLRYLKDTVVPLLREQRGFRGVTASVDRAGGVLGVLSLWETEADRDASESPMSKTRAEAQRVIGGELSVEEFEELLVEMRGRPEVGQALLLRRTSMAPDKIDGNLDYFRQEVLPQIASAPGFRTLRNMINRRTGEGMVGSLWADAAARDAAAAAAEARRPQAAQRGVTLGEQSKRELVYVELP